jgi:BioD-like phosphotransacetylase family protein
LVITSTRTAAGKTTVGLGIGLNTNLKLGYFKPFGDHLVYSKKCLADLDCIVYNEWLGLESSEEERCLGFDPEKITSHWIPEEISGVLKKMHDKTAEGKDMVFIETGCNFSYGGMMRLDSISIAKTLGADMLLVADGNVDLIIDKALAVSRCMENNARLTGVVINKCEDNQRTRLEEEGIQVLQKAGIDVLGILPRQPLLERIDIDQIINKLNAKLVAGTEGEKKPVDTVLVGALSADQAMKAPEFHQDNKLIITGGDRVDLIFASLDEETSGIILTNNILPHPKVMAKADEINLPILSVPMDTYTTAKAVHKMIADIDPSDTDKKELIKDMVAKEVNLKAILE